MRALISHFAFFTLALGAELTWDNQTHAGLMPVSSTVTSNGGGSSFTYSYALALTQNATLQAGNYFTIYDFQGLLPNSNTQPAGFAFSTSLVGPTPGGTTPVDNPGISNVTWTYTGSGAPVGPTNLGSFTVQSTSGVAATGTFTSLALQLAGDNAINTTTQAQVSVPSGSGSDCGSSGDPVVSTLGGASGPSVPEPTSLVLLCVGLPLLGLVCYRRKQLSERLAAHSE
jgi:PEP-CTERM motif